MKSKCLYCYNALDDNDVDYHTKCIKEFYGTRYAPTLPYKLSEMEKLAKKSDTNHKKMCYY